MIRQELFFETLRHPSYPFYNKMCLVKNMHLFQMKQQWIQKGKYVAIGIVAAACFLYMQGPEKYDQETLNKAMETIQSKMTVANVWNIVDQVQGACNWVTWKPFATLSTIVSGWKPQTRAEYDEYIQDLTKSGMRAAGGALHSAYKIRSIHEQERRERERVPTDFIKRFNARRV